MYLWTAAAASRHNSHMVVWDFLPSEHITAIMFSVRLSVLFSPLSSYSLFSMKQPEFTV